MQTSVQREAEKCKNFQFLQSEIRTSGRMTIFHDFLPLNGIFKKTNLVSFSYLPRPSNRPSMSKIDFTTVATISLISPTFTLNSFRSPNNWASIQYTVVLIEQRTQYTTERFNCLMASYTGQTETTNQFTLQRQMVYFQGSTVRIKRTKVLLLLEEICYLGEAGRKSS